MPRRRSVLVSPLNTRPNSKNTVSICQRWRYASAIFIAATVGGRFVNNSMDVSSSRVTDFSFKRIKRASPHEIGTGKVVAPEQFLFFPRKDSPSAVCNIIEDQHRKNTEREMTSPPTTRLSLILKLPDAQNAQAWDEFVRLYQPVVYRFARRRGFQHADAEEVVQEAMLAVSRAVDKWVPDPARGRFRSWLHRIACNLMINFVTRRKHQVWGAGGSGLQRLFEEVTAPDPVDSAEFDIEFQRELYCLAVERVQYDVKENTWKAFWLSAVDDLPALEVARRLGMTIGSVYIARSRVMARLREEVRRIKETEPSGATERKA